MEKVGVVGFQRSSVAGGAYVSFSQVATAQNIPGLANLQIGILLQPPKIRSRFPPRMPPPGRPHAPFSYLNLNLNMNLNPSVAVVTSGSNSPSSIPAS